MLIYYLWLLLTWLSNCTRGRRLKCVRLHFVPSNRHILTKYWYFRLTVKMRIKNMENKKKNPINTNMKRANEKWWKRFTFGSTVWQYFWYASNSFWMFRFVSANLELACLTRSSNSCVSTLKYCSPSIIRRRSIPLLAYPIAASSIFSGGPFTYTISTLDSPQPVSSMILYSDIFWNSRCTCAASGRKKSALKNCGYSKGQRFVLPWVVYPLFPVQRGHRWCAKINTVPFVFSYTNSRHWMKCWVCRSPVLFPAMEYLRNELIGNRLKFNWQMFSMHSMKNTFKYGAIEMQRRQNIFATDFVQNWISAARYYEIGVCFGTCINSTKMNDIFP